MLCSLPSRIFGLIRKQQVQIKHSIRIISILAILFIPARLVNVPLAPAGAPPGWTAHNPIVVRAPPAGGAMAPLAFTGFSPAQIRKAYGIDLLGSNGAGKTIAIIDAYGNPTMAADLMTFNAQFGLPSIALTIAYPGGTPGADSNWALETALDVEWAHAIAPAANILLVVALTASRSDLLTAVDYANNNGADVVSMSWGGSEFPGEATYDSYFNHSGVTYLASSGDSGAGVSWPAVSPYVVAVGGTTLNVDSSDNYISESAWSGSGGGISAFIARPSYQNGFQTAGNRGIPDVAFDADPASGVAVYCSSHPSSPWVQVGGTSLSAPCWAGLFALGGLSGVPAVYAQASTGPLYASNYHDITSGSSGNPAGAGYDLVTGLGSPQANNLVPGTASQLSFTTQPSVSNSVGAAFSTQPVVALQDARGNTVTTANASVTLSITPGTGTTDAALSGDISINAVNGVATFSGLSIDKIGSGYTLTAISSGLTDVTSDSFNIVEITSKLSVAGYVSPATAGVAGSITVTAQDAAGNTITNYTGTMHFTSSDTQAVLPSDYTFVSGDNGTHTFSATLKTAGSQSISATDTVTVSITGSQSGISVNAAVASQIRVETAANGSGNAVSAQDVTSGNFITVYAITRDQYGNFVANAVGTWSLVSKTGGIANGDLVAAGDNKSAVFTGHVIGTAAIHVISGSLTPIDSGTLTVLVGTISKLSVAVYVSPATAGVAGSITVTAQDAAGNTITNYTGTVHFTSSDTQAVLPSDYTFVSGDNGTHTFSATLKTAGSQSISATDTVTVSITGSQSGIIVNAAVASQIRVETAANGSGNAVSAQDVTSGNFITVYAITRDQYGNFVANAVGTWSLVSKTGGIANGDLVAAGDNKSAVFTGHVIGTAAIHVISGSLTPIDSGTLTVLVGTISKLSVAVYVSPATAGVAGSITVTAQDAAGNTITNYTGTMHFTSSDTQAVLPSDYTFVSGDNGTHTFSATLKTAGSQSISATDTVTVSITGSQSGIIVNAAVASQIRVETAANGSGNAVSAQDVTSGNFITVYAITRDQYGNFVANAVGTWSLVSKTGGIANGDLVAAGDNKSAVFTGHVIGTAAIHVISGSLTPIDSGTLTVLVGTISKLSVAVYVSPATAGVAGSITVTAQDAAGNTITNYTGTMHFTSSDTQAVLPSDYTFVSGDNGTHTFSATLKTAGSQSISATDTVTVSITGSQSGISVNATTSNKLVILTSAQTLTAGVTSGTITIQRQDQFGNANAAEVNLIVNLSSNSTGTHVFRDNSDTTNISNVTINQGGSSASFKYKDNKAGTPTITSESGSLTNGTQQETVNAAVASQIRVETAANGSGNVVSAQDVTSGNFITVYAITRDQYGNFVANAVGTWSLINKTGGIADNDLVAAGDNKSAVFTGHVIGTVIVHVTSGSLTYTDSGMLTIIPSPPSDGGGGGGGGPIGPITVAGVTNITSAINAQGIFNQDVNLWSDDNSVLLHIPTGTAGLTSSGTPLTQISMIHVVTPPPLPAGANIISLVYDFTPSGVTFNPPAIIRFGYDPTLIPAGVDAISLQIAYYDSAQSAWITLTTTSVDTEHHFIFAQITHFTSYAITYGVKAVILVPTTTPAVITTPTTTTVVTTTPTTTPAVITTPTTTTVVITTPTTTPAVITTPITTTVVTTTPTTTTTVTTSTTQTIPTSPTKQKSGDVNPPIIIIIAAVVAMVISLVVFLMKRKPKK